LQYNPIRSDSSKSHTKKCCWIDFVTRKSHFYRYDSNEQISAVKVSSPLQHPFCDCSLLLLTVPQTKSWREGSCEAKKWVYIPTKRTN